MHTHRMNRTVTLLSAVVCVLSALASEAATAVDITDLGNYGPLGEGNTAFGWQFSTFQSIQITAWGLYDHGSNGLAGADGFEKEHVISLWTPTETLLTSAVIPNGTQAPLQGYFRYMPSGGFHLDPGTYIISSAAINSDRDFVPSAVQSALFDPAITYLGGRYSHTGGFPTIALGGPSDPPRYFGPNFEFVVVPEPSTISLLALALFIGVWTLQRRHA